MVQYYRFLERLFSLTILSGLLLTLSCSKDGSNNGGDPTPESITTNLQSDEMFLQNSETSGQLTLNTTKAWTLELTDTKASPGWLTASPVSGGAGQSAITITISTSNDSYEDRNAFLKIKSGSLQKIFTITQKRKGAIILNSDRVEVPFRGGRFDVTLKSNLDASVSVLADAADWISRISVNESTKALADKTFSFNAKEGSKEGNRQGRIVFHEGTISDTLTVYQSFKPSIILGSDVRNISDAGGVIDVDITTNVEYETICDPLATWISIIETKATRVDKVSFVVSANESYEERSAKVIFKDKNNLTADTLTINQTNKNGIILTSKRVIMPFNGGSVKVELKASSEYDIQFISGSDWLSRTDSKAFTTYEHTFSAGVNNSDSERKAKISFKSKTGNLSDTLTVIQESNVDEKAALTDFFNKANGNGWTRKDNWCSDKPLSEWFGITVENGKITGIALENNNLTGTISAEIEKLRRLKVLNLYNNKLTGSIPETIGGCNDLSSLNIALNKLSGSIPETLSLLENLNDVWLQFNSLTGSIPSALFNLKRLKEADLSYNKLSGVIPDNIGNLSSIIYLSLSGNALSGSVPASVGSLQNLTYLLLGSNQLTGSIPESLFRIEKLKSFSADYNHLSGTLPEDVKFAKGIDRLDLYGNELSGKIPAGLSQILGNPGLFIDLLNNKFSGEIPYEVVSHPNWDKYVFNIFRQNGYNLDVPEGYLKVPEFKLKDINGIEYDSNIEFRKNRYTILYLWATWCPFSLAFNPEVRSIRDQFSNELGLISFNVEDDVAAISKYIGDNNLNWKNFIKSNNNGFDYYSLISPRILRYPSVLVVDDKGNIVYDFTQDRDKLRDFLAVRLGDNGTLYSSADYSQDGKVTVLQRATKGNGVNLILMGDGYSDKEFAAGGKYQTTMERAYQHFFSIEPVKSYKEYFNVYYVNVVSKNEIFTTYSNTALGVEFSGGTSMTAQFDKCATYAGKVSGLDISKALVMVIANSSQWAGTTHFFQDGKTFALLPAGSGYEADMGSLVHHEGVGHGLGRLLDEYIYYRENITQEAKNDILEFQRDHKMGFNISVSKINSEIPWKHFIGNISYPMTGLYEGAFFYSYGVWRAEQFNCMIDNIPYFNGPSRELIVRRIKELAGETYQWSDFLAKDKYVPAAVMQTKSGTKSGYTTTSATRPPLAPPVLHPR